MKILYKLLTSLIFFINIDINAQTILERYIQEGIENNIVLQQKKICYEQASYSLKIATSYFFPSLNLNTSYTSGEGGRSIFFPIGDMLNPVYNTLNQLISSNKFPQIGNVNENLAPYKFYDIKLRTSLPIINTELIYNRNINSSQEKIAEYEAEMYKRELVKEIKIAYYNYLSAEAAISIYNNALSIANEGKRVQESLLKNGNGLAVYILRTDSEIENILTKKTEAQNQSLSTKYYFNFLLNRKLDARIDSDSSLVNIIVQYSDNPNNELSLSGREELLILSKVTDIKQSVIDMNKYYWIPKISAFLDLGAQDQKWNYDSQARYYLFGIQLDVPIFESFRKHYKIEQSELDVKNAELNSQLVTSQLSLGFNITRNELTLAYQNYKSSLKQFDAAQAYYKLVVRGFHEGINTFLEIVDARTQLLNSELSVNITKYKIMIATANYERETNLNKNEY